MRYQLVHVKTHPYDCVVPGVLTTGSTIEVRGKPLPEACSLSVTLQSEVKGDESRIDNALGLTVSFEGKKQRLSCWSQIGENVTEELVDLNFCPFIEQRNFFLRILVAATHYKIIINDKQVIDFHHQIASEKVSHLALDGDAKFDAIQFVCGDYVSPLWCSYLSQDSESAFDFSKSSEEVDQEWEHFMRAGDTVKLNLFNSTEQESENIPPLQQKKAKFDETDIYFDETDFRTKKRGSEKYSAKALKEVNSDKTVDTDTSEIKTLKRQKLHVHFEMDVDKIDENNLTSPREEVIIEDHTKSVQELRLLFENNPDQMTSAERRNYQRARELEELGKLDFSSVDVESDMSFVESMNPQITGRAGKELDVEADDREILMFHATPALGRMIGDADNELITGNEKDAVNQVEIIEDNVTRTAAGTQESMLDDKDDDNDASNDKYAVEDEIIQEVHVQEKVVPQLESSVFASQPVGQETSEEWFEGKMPQSGSKYRDSGISSFRGSYGEANSYDAEDAPLLGSDGDEERMLRQNQFSVTERSEKVLRTSDNLEESDLLDNSLQTDRKKLNELTRQNAQYKNMQHRGCYLPVTQSKDLRDSDSECHTPDSGMADEDFRFSPTNNNDQDDNMSVSEKDYSTEKNDSLTVITWHKPAPEKGFDLPYTQVYPDGLQIGTCVYINGIVNSDAKSFNVIFQSDGELPHTTIAFQMRPVFEKKGNKTDNYVLCNSFVMSNWEEEVKCCEGILDMFPFELGKAFLMRIVVKDEMYQVSVDGKYALTFPHRILPSEITQVKLDGDVSFQNLEKPDELELPYFVKIPRGLHTGKTIWIEAMPEADAKRFHVSFQCPAYNDIAIPFRMKVLLDGGQRIVCSSYYKGMWDEREFSSGTTPFTEDIKFRMKINVAEDCFRVMVNGLSFAEYRLVLPVHHISHMEIDGDISLYSVDWHDVRSKRRKSKAMHLAEGCCYWCCNIL